MSVPLPEDAAAVGAKPSVIFVDLDCTLSASDLLADATLLAIRKRPLNAWRIAGWLRGGRAEFKRKMTELFTPDVANLPYQAVVLDYLKAERAKGRTLVLATASDEIWARRVAAELDLFDDVLASDGVVNLKGAAKLQAIQAYCRERSIESFEYIGDSRADRPIWAAAAAPMLMDNRRQVLRPLSSGPGPGSALDLRSAIRALRPQQWVKNLLLVTPLMLSHQVSSPAKLLAAGLAFIAFSLCASAIYVVNDLLDIEVDRRHPKKRHRPFASGRLPVLYGPPLALLLGATGVGLALLGLPPGFLVILLGYLVLTSLYSFWLKSKVMIDIVVLAVLYTTRVIAGGEATGTPVSEWMLAFSMFIFTSLAFAKRYSELVRVKMSDDVDRDNGRGYLRRDLQMLSTMGPASGYLSVLVLALYLNSEAVRGLYGQGLLLWLLCPLMLYWVGRLWIFAGRGHLPDDPVAFAVTDRVSWGIALLAGALLFFAI